MVEGTMELIAPAQQVYDLLADYDRVGDVFSNILQSSTEVDSDSSTTLHQVGPYSLLLTMHPAMLTIHPAINVYA